MAQSTFRFLADIETRPAPCRPRSRPVSVPAAWSKMDYDMLLTRALHRHTLSHPVYACLVATAHGQFHQPQPSTITRIATALGISYHAVVWHLRKYPDLFHLDESRSPLRVTLSKEGQQLLAAVHTTLHLYRSQS
jgi:hypothetical protein